MELQPCSGAIFNEDFMEGKAKRIWNETLRKDVMAHIRTALSSLRTTLCVQFKSEVVACGVVYAAARRVLAHLYSLPKAQHIPVCKDGDSFTSSNKSRDAQTQPVSKEVLQSGPSANNDTVTPKAASTLINPESGGSKNSMVKQALDMLKESKKGDDDPKSMAVEGEGREEPIPSKSEHRTEASGERNKERERERERDRDRDRDRERERAKARDRDRGRILIGNGSVMRLTRTGRRNVVIYHYICFVDLMFTTGAGGHSEKSRRHSSRDRDYHSSSYSSGRRIAIDIILTLEPVAKKRQAAWDTWGRDVTITMVVVETSEDDGWSREIGGSVEEKKEAG
ncbi:Cyclin-L1-1 [Vitis vinifera]|uniref:Cyclin-L1-1 n=1 Tax=Vitis vinifera TaxID=29760 RepID=A0A438CGU6_VITVI|nr:Cyclin-L1-1 [Vitis vinifera]